MHLNFEARDPVLVVTAAGEVSLEEALGVFKQSVDAAAERGLRLLVVDCLGVRGELSTLERFELGHTMSEYAAKKSPALKVATVGRPPLINGFAAQVAFNRGITAETFSDVEHALGWLNRFAITPTADSLRK